MFDKIIGNKGKEDVGIAEKCDRAEERVGVAYNKDNSDRSSLRNCSQTIFCRVNSKGKKKGWSDRGYIEIKWINKKG